jgi:multidrug transporter EmrE-like cation transporter
MNLIKGILWGALGQIISFLQLQGSVKFGWNKTYPFLIYGGAVLGMWIFIQSVENFVIAYNGQLWPSRLIGFGIGVIVFTTMSWLLFKEPMTLKTIICLGLAATLVGIQVLWK